MIDKKTARAEARKYREELSENEAQDFSERITEKLLGLREFDTAKTIYIYRSVNNEVDTEAIINASMRLGKTVAFPRVVDDEILFYKVTDVNELEFGYYGIPEPVENPDNLVDTQDGLVVIPGVAFDKSFHRVGYGGGFYDRFLAGHMNLVKIALAYEKQIFDEIESADCDIEPDMIITENTIYRR